MTLDWLIHAPWWLAALVAIAGFAVLWSGMRRLDKPMRRAGIIIVLVGVLLGIMGQLFPSDREKMLKRTGDLIAAINASDWNKLSSLLDDGTSVGTVNIQWIQGRKGITDTTREEATSYHLTGISIMDSKATQDETEIAVVAKIACKSGDFLDRPVPVQCEFDYAKFGGRWELQKILFLDIAGENPDTAPIHARR